MVRRDRLIVAVEGVVGSADDGGVPGDRPGLRRPAAPDAHAVPLAGLQVKPVVRVPPVAHVPPARPAGTNAVLGLDPEASGQNPGIAAHLAGYLDLGRRS